MVLKVRALHRHGRTGYDSTPRTIIQKVPWPPGGSLTPLSMATRTDDAKGIRTVEYTPPCCAVCPKSPTPHGSAGDCPERPCPSGENLPTLACRRRNWSVKHALSF